MIYPLRHVPGALAGCEVFSSGEPNSFSPQNMTTAPKQVQTHLSPHQLANTKELVKMREEKVYLPWEKGDALFQPDPAENKRLQINPSKHPVLLLQQWNKQKADLLFQPNSLTFTIGLLSPSYLFKRNTLYFWELRTILTGMASIPSFPTAPTSLSPKTMHALPPPPQPLCHFSAFDTQSTPFLKCHQPS